MKRNILILAPYCSLPGEKKFNRFLYMAEMLSSHYDVTLVTSEFRHYDKLHRVENTPNCNFNIVKIYEPGYSDNVSFQRVYSHRIFLKNFIAWFGCNKHKFDIIYSGYPLISTNVFLSKNKERFNYNLIIDIQDVWPEAISAAFPFVSLLPKWLLPFTRSANFCYKNADGIIAVSQTYLERALKVSNPKKSDVIYIGSDATRIASSSAMDVKNDAIKLIYIGSLGYSYDVETVLRSVNNLVLQGYNIEFHIVGGGKQEERLKNIAAKNVYFHGFVSYEKMVSLVKSSNLGVNSLVSSAPQSITNKLSDYFSIGIPILNSQKTPELLDLLNSYNHVDYISGDVPNCELAIKSFINNEKLHSFSPNKDFFRENSYSKVIDMIEFLS